MDHNNVKNRDNMEDKRGGSTKFTRTAEKGSRGFSTYPTAWFWHLPTSFFFKVKNNLVGMHIAHGPQ